MSKNPYCEWTTIAEESFGDHSGPTEVWHWCIRCGSLKLGDEVFAPGPNQKPILVATGKAKPSRHEIVTKLVHDKYSDQVEIAAGDNRDGKERLMLYHTITEENYFVEVVTDENGNISLIEDKSR